MTNFNFSYDKKFDDLLLNKGKCKSAGSMEVGDLILDFDKRNQLVGVQFVNASKLMKNIFKDERDFRELLGSLKRVDVSAARHRNLMTVSIVLVGDMNNEEQELSSNISIFVNESPAIVA